jgi:hypothetical protein
MIEQLNRQRVLAFLEDFSAGDIEAALGRCSDDVDFLTHAPIDLLPHMIPCRGKAEVRKMWQTIHSRYSNLRYETPVVVAEADKVAFYLRAFFRKRGNDRLVQFDMAAFYTLRDGRITQIREILDSFDLIQQVLERDIAAALAGGKPDKI